MEGRWEHSAIARVRDDFDCGCRVPDVYEKHEKPRVCAVVQSFNHRANVVPIARSLVTNSAIDEIVICEDGSNDGSLESWAEVLNGINHFIIVSNNLHEVRCYNRAMRISSADYFVFMQDDDIPLTGADNGAAGEDGARGWAASGERAKAKEATGLSAGENWVTDALGLFDADMGYEFGEQQSDHGGLRKGSTRRIPFLSPQTGKPFMYAECGWIAPLFVRAEVLRRVGGLDINLFKVGEPGMWQDCLLSYAAWSAGWRVGVYDAMFGRGVGGHGSTRSRRQARMRGIMWRKAKALADARFERDYVRDFALRLNNETLRRRYPTPGAVAAAPYKGYKSAS
jgi:GT2 family glycosyltransferase